MTRPHLLLLVSLSFTVDVIATRLRSSQNSSKTSKLDSLKPRQDSSGVVMTWLDGSFESRAAQEARVEQTSMELRLGRSGASTELLGNSISSRLLEALVAGLAADDVAAAGGAEPSLTSPLRGELRAASASPKKSTPAVLDLTDIFGAEYVGVIGVGTGPTDEAPESELHVIYDTGSADLWVASDLCYRLPCLEEKRQRYNHTRSRTFQAMSISDGNYVTVYGSGELSGKIGVDDVRVGSLIAKKQQLGLIQDEIGPAFRHVPFDGIVGLGFAALTRATGATPLVQRLIDQDQLPSPQFSFYLHREPALGGVLLWGDANPHLYKGNLIWAPVTDDQYWAVELLAFQVGNFTLIANTSTRHLGVDGLLRKRSPSGRDSWSDLIPPSRMSLLVDSGTTFITLLPDMYRATLEVTRTRPCAEIADSPPLIFTILSDRGLVEDLVVSPEEYMVRSTWDDSVCYPGVVQTMDEPRDSPMLILGEVFMRHHYTVFHWGDGKPARRHFNGSTRPEGAHIGFASACGSDEAHAALMQT